MNQELITKVIKLAAQICWMHGSVAGDRICQDWSGETGVLDSLTPEERDILQRQYQDYNSGDEDFEPGYFPYDEMLISFMIARALDVLETLRYISELHDYLWRFVRVTFPGASGNLADYVDRTLAQLQDDRLARWDEQLRRAQ